MATTRHTPTLTVLDEDRHAWFAGRTRAILKFLDAELGPAPANTNRRVLDLGGGAGNMAHHLAHYGHVVNLDPSGRPLAVALARGLENTQASGDALPFADHSFDLVALLDTVEHIPNELGVLAECRRVLQPGGKLMVTVPAYQWLWSYNDVINDHQRRYTASDLRHKLSVNGFRVKRVSYHSFFLFPLIAALRLLRADEPELDSPHLSDEEAVYQVEMEPIPEPVNTVLHAAYRVEAELVQRVDLPFGTSVIAIAEKAQTQYNVNSKVTNKT